RRSQQPPGRLVADRARGVAGRFERGVEDGGFSVVERQDLGQRVLTLARVLLAPACGLRMQPGPLAPRQRAVGHLLDEDVAEVVAVALRGADEVAVDQVLAQRLHARRVALLEGGDAGGPERAPEDAAQLQEAPL